MKDFAVLVLNGNQIPKYRLMFETQTSGSKTSSGEIGLNIRIHASPNVGVGKDQVSAGVSVLCWHAFHGNITELGKKSNAVIRSRSVTRSNIGGMSDQ